MNVFSADEISRFSHTASSIRWHTGPAYVNTDDKTLLLTVKPGVRMPF